MTTISNEEIRELVTEAELTQTVIELVRNRSIRLSSWYHSAVAKRLNVLRVEGLIAKEPESFNEVVELLERQYVPLQSQLLLRLPKCEQLYLTVVTQSRRQCYDLFIKCGAQLIEGLYNDRRTPQIRIYTTLPVEKFLAAVQQQWTFCEWNELLPLVDVRHITHK